MLNSGPASEEASFSGPMRQVFVVSDKPLVVCLLSGGRACTECPASRPVRVAWFWSTCGICFPVGVGVRSFLHIAGENTVVPVRGRIWPNGAYVCAIPACLRWGHFFSVGRGCTACPADRPRELRGAPIGWLTSCQSQVWPQVSPKVWGFRTNP